MPDFKLTYATMSNLPEVVHSRYELELKKTRDNLGKTYGMIIDNKDHFVERTFENRSPINTDWLLGHFPDGTAMDANLAIASAKRAAPKWSALRWQDRAALVRRAADLIEERVYKLAVATTLECREKSI
jgi:1-pyrroline-5-carboxylate dehydrogenase